MLGALVLGALLGVLARTAGLGAGGWAVGIGSGGLFLVLTWRGLGGSGVRAVGSADAITLGRGLLACAVAALTVESLLGRDVTLAVARGGRARTRPWTPWTAGSRGGPTA